MVGENQGFDPDLDNLPGIFRGIGIQGNCVILTDYPNGYSIALHRCDTPEKLLAWVCHLTGKPWFDLNNLCEGFIKTVAEANNIVIPKIL